jgi:hypothetical protein
MFFNYTIPKSLMYISHCLYYSILALLSESLASGGASDMAMMLWAMLARETIICFFRIVTVHVFVVLLDFQDVKIHFVLVHCAG